MEPLTLQQFEDARKQMLELIAQRCDDLLLGMMTDEQIAQLADDWNSGRDVQDDA